MVQAVLDYNWSRDGLRFERAKDDQNNYILGFTGGHNIVLAYCSEMGSISSSVLASGLRSSFPTIKLVLVVGICGAVPFNSGQEVVLGDCNISSELVKFDFGRRGPAGFQTKSTLPRISSSELEGLKKKLQASKNQLQEQIVRHLQDLQEHEPMRSTHPGHGKDRLFESSYIHTHHDSIKACRYCNQKLGICNRSCDEIGCDDSQLIRRDRSEINTQSKLHFGIVGSSDSVIKHGIERDELAEEYGFTAFEMEAFGFCRTFPTLVIKGVSDYADSHKNDEWHSYAAAVAVASLKPALGIMDLSEEEDKTESTCNHGAINFLRIISAGLTIVDMYSATSYRGLPFSRDPDFVQRDELIASIDEKFQKRQDEIQLRIAMDGIGGVR